MKLSPKRLTFDEMWQLHKTIKNSLPASEKEFLVHEAISILENITPGDFKTVLVMFYGNKFYLNKNPADFALMLIKGIKGNSVTLFESFIKSFSR